MALAIFGISNTGLNLAVTLVLLMLVVVWVSLIVYTFFDARRRIDDPFMVACATLASLFPYIGTAVYVILRPPEFIEDAKERHLEIKRAEMELAHLMESSCPNCHFPIEGNYLRCPSCQRRLKDPCRSCGKAVDPRWALCPFCETALPGRSRRQEGERGSSSAPPKGSSKAPSRSGAPDRKDKTSSRRSGSRDAAPSRGSSRSGSSRKSTPINSRSDEVDAASAASRDSAPARNSASPRGSSPSTGKAPSPSPESPSSGNDAPAGESRPSSRRSSRPASGRRPQKPTRSSSASSESSEESAKRSGGRASPAPKHRQSSGERDPDSTDTP